jgi:2-dehydro-3-deoxygluconokinase
MYDLVTLGEVLLRLAIPSPSRFETVHVLDVQIGGAEANVATVCARLGLRTAWISALPDNPWAERVRRQLISHGVDCSHVVTFPGSRLGLYFLEYGVAPRPVRVLYDRRDSAFAQLTSDAVNWSPIQQARIVHVSGVTPALGSPARALAERIFDEAQAVSFDVNYRANLWRPSEARSFAEAILPRARYVFLGRKEAETVFGLNGTSESILGELASRASSKAVIALLEGADGSAVLDNGRVWRPSIRHNVQVVDSIGAGDAYVGGYLWAMLTGKSPQEAVNIAATVAALKCSTWGDFALVTKTEVEETLAGGPDVRR